MLSDPRVRRACSAAALSLILAASPAAAGPAPPFPDLLREAESRAPQIIAAEAEAARARGLRDQAAVRPNPSASLTVENFAGERPFAGLGGAETTLSLAQPFELGGKRGARTAAARAEIAAADARLVQARADFAHDLAVAYADAEAAVSREGLAADALRFAQEDARAVAAMVQAGKEAEVRALQVRSAASAAESDYAVRKVERAAAFARLAALAGASEPYTALSGAVLQAPLSSAPAGAAGEAPAVAAAAAEREAAAGRVAVERARATPDLTASVGVRRNGLEDATSLVASVSAPLPLFDRNRGNVAAAQAGVRAADARLEQARRNASADLAAAQVQLETAESRLRAAESGAADSREVADLTRLGYEGGKLSLMELVAARRADVEARTRVLDAQLARAKALAERARLQGRRPFGS